MSGLTPKQTKFIDTYIETGNASEAYRQAYSCQNMKDSTINVKASEMLKNGKIRVRIEELQRDLKKSSDIRKEAILEELSCIAFADIRDYVKFTGKRISFKSFDELTDRQARAIESIKKSKYGIELKLHGKNWTIERICKMLGYDSPQELNLNFENMNDPSATLILTELVKRSKQNE